MSNKAMNALFGGQPENLTYIGYGECPDCGDDCAEFWRDDNTGNVYVRCPYFMCDNFQKLRLVEVDA